MTPSAVKKDFQTKGCHCYRTMSELCCLTDSAWYDRNVCICSQGNSSV